MPIVKSVKAYFSKITKSTTSHKKNHYLLTHVNVIVLEISAMGGSKSSKTILGNTLHDTLKVWIVASMANLIRSYTHNFINLILQKSMIAIAIVHLYFESIDICIISAIRNITLVKFIK